ncbi:MAG: TonB-dependent receptor domain-containing protein, partial [Bryobacteraceae bacterium]
FHGSAYEYFRHDQLDARSFFAPEEPRLRYNLFGASLGGPIRRNKAHFFFTYEGLRRNNPRTRILNIPDLAETRGDFSRSATIIRDPQAAGRPPFPRNIIPADRLDPVGAKIATFYPEPNVAGRPSGDANFVRNQGLKQDTETYIGRLDYSHTANDRIFGRLLASDLGQHILPVFSAAGLDPFETFNKQKRYNASATWLHHFAPAIINELRFTFSNSTGEVRPAGLDLGLAEQIGIRGTNPAFPPQINMGPRFQALGVGGGYHNGPMRHSQLTETVTYIRGSHAIKLGYEWRPNAARYAVRGQAGGSFSFGEAATGNSVASLLLGWVQQGVRNETLPGRVRSLTMSGFVQDDWLVSSRLSLNLGLRWDWDQPRWEELGNRQNSFDRYAINPVSGTPGVVAFSGRNGVSKFAHRHDWNNFGPRIGFAWRAAENWVVRGGGALVYAGEYAAAFGGGVSPTLGFSINGTFQTPDGGLTPPFLLRNGLPAIQTPTEADLTPGFGAVQAGRIPTTAVQFYDPDRRTGYLETFNFNIQRKFTNDLMAEIGYLGTLGHK